jgi:predicted N-acyltransferase
MNWVEKTTQRSVDKEKIDEKIKWNNKISRLGRGFSSFDDYLQRQKELREERRKIIEEVKK